MNDEKLNTIQKYIKDINLANKNKECLDINKLFESMVQLERDFKEIVITTKSGKKAYTEFTRFILMDTDRGLLNIRPYFRMRETEFKPLNKAVEKSDIETVMRFPINFLMCSFLMKNMDNVSSELNKIFNKIKTLREEIINYYLHTGLTKTKSFNKTVSTTYYIEDLVQIANEAIIAAIDKYVYDNKDNLNSVVMGRIAGHFINNGANIYSVSIGAAANKKLYKIKSLLEDRPGLTPKQISDIIKIDESEIVDLMSSTLYMSLDSQIDDTNNRYVDQISYDESHIDDIMIHNEKLSLLSKNIDKLSFLEKKLLVLMGYLEIEQYYELLHKKNIKNYSLLEKKLLILKGELSYE